MMIKTVIGLGFGDEGKGLTTDYLCSKSYNPLVIRFSGGQQAGHTVLLNGIRHTFANFGSGTLRGAPTYWTSICTFDPIGCMNEYDDLIKKGVKPKLYVDAKCPVTTHFDKKYNKKVDAKNGTCGVGVGTTLQREEDHYSLLFEDLSIPWILRTKLEMIAEYYDNHNSYSIERFMEVCKEVVACKSIGIVHEPFLGAYETYIYEGSQGLLLDKDIGFFPHVTRSNTGTKNSGKGDVYMVTRAYQTRHGNGQMSNEQYEHEIKLDPNENNVTNTYQGKFRRSILDLDLLKYAISKDDHLRTTNNKVLVITCLDHVENNWHLTCDETMISFDNEEAFVSKIASELDVKHVYLSRSAESKNIELIS